MELKTNFYVCLGVGRKATSIPGMLVMGGGFAVLARAGSQSALAAASVMIGVGNGLTSGLVQLLAQDMAPPPPDAGALHSNEHLPLRNPCFKIRTREQHLPGTE